MDYRDQIISTIAERECARIIDYILNEYVLSQAADYSNRRIREYPESQCGE